MNPERAIVGLVTTFGEPDVNDGTVWQARQFAEFADEYLAVEMLLEHRHPLDVDSPGVLGTWREFAAVAEGSTPAGLLAIGEFGYSPTAENLLRQLADDHDPIVGVVGWGLSVTAADASPHEDGSLMWVKEASLTRRPAYEQARVIGVGPYALDVWTLLTGRKPPKMVATTPRTTHRRLVAMRGGRPIYHEWQE